MIGAIVAGLLAASPAPAPAQPFTWPVPQGWRSEAFSFPLDFAPEIHHSGTEALRFMPGMFKPGPPDFWSYAFVWWLDGKAEWTPRTLEHELDAYFAGLARAVDPKGFAASKVQVSTALRSEPTRAPVRARYAGAVQSYDPFATHAPIRLNVRARVFDCSGHTVALFEVSPRPVGPSTWPALNDAVGAFRCPDAH